MRALSIVLGGALLLAATGCENPAPRHTGTPGCKACAAGTHGQGVTAASPVAAGLKIQPTANTADYANDFAPAQVFEIVHDGDLTLGRVWMDCTCVTAAKNKGSEGSTDYAADEAALVTVRQLEKAAAPTYRLHVQVLKPTATVLSFDVPVKQ